MGRKKLAAALDPNIPFICCVCGDTARGNNFSVLSCVACKSFFRRYGLSDHKDLQCRYRTECIITKDSRNDCIRCRIKKCLESGMDPKMIRCPPGQKENSTKKPQKVTTNEMQLQLPTPKPLNLVRTDLSTLTSDQWNLVSNMIRSYDEQNAINRVKYLLDEKSSLPPKLRLKPADTVNLLGESLKDIIPLMQHSPHFRSLSSHATRALILHNLYYTGSFSGYLVARETNTFRNPIFIDASSMLLGREFIMECARDNERLVANENIIKLMLFALIFSSNCSIVMFNNEEDLKTMSSTMELIGIQNIYVTILWKYLVYLCGYDGAAIHFCSLIKNVTDMLYRAEESSKRMASMILVDRIVTQTERSLTITDSIWS